MPGERLATRLLWPALLLAVCAYVVADFVQHPFLGSFGEAAAAPEAHLTLWLAETETSADTEAAVRDTADSLLLYGRGATVGVLPGGSSSAVVRFLSQPQPAAELLVVSSETVADLAQERGSALVGEEPVQAALAQRLLARAIPVGVLSEDPLTIAVPGGRASGSQVHNVAELMADIRESPQRHVFATTDDNWAADNLAALVSEAGVEGVVPYRVFPSVQDAALAPAAGSAEVMLAPRGAILPELREGRLRALAWPAGVRPAPSWVELLAAPGTPASQIAALRHQLRALSHDVTWRRMLRENGQEPARELSDAQLDGFLALQSARIAQLQELASRVERH